VKVPLPVPDVAPWSSIARTIYEYVRFDLSLPIVTVVGPVVDTGMKRETSGSTPSVW
jgi:hypothetical protein